MFVGNALVIYVLPNESISQDSGGSHWQDKYYKSIINVRSTTETLSTKFDTTTTNNLHKQTFIKNLALTASFIYSHLRNIINNDLLNNFFPDEAKSETGQTNCNKKDSDKTENDNRRSNIFNFFFESLREVFS